MQRMLIGLGFGGAIAFCLFVLMSYLIKRDVDIIPSEALPPIDLILEEQDDEVRRRSRRLPEKKPPPKVPPPPQTAKTKQTSKPVFNKIDFKIEKVKLGNMGDIYVGQSGSSNLGDGEAIAMTTFAPPYPDEAMRKGTEGWVRFEFTVAADGSPKDIKIIESKPRRIFDRAARRAIIKWRFKPKIVDGKAVEQPNMKYTMQFKLED
jgi:protein TonB